MTRAAPSDIAGLARFIRSDECQHIAILSGHGVSASSGFPEYKTKPPSPFLPTSDNPDLPLTVTDDAQRQLLNKNPSYVLTWDLFRENALPYLEVQRPFILGTQEQKWKATVCHKFAQLLHTKTGKLRRVYTHNIDGLDFQYRGLPVDKILPVNGSLAQAACEGCGAPADYDRFCEAVRTNIKDVRTTSSAKNHDEKDKGAAPQSPAESTPILCENCQKPLVKPTVVLLRRRSTPETLHRAFFEQMKEDLPHLDLLLILEQKMWALPTDRLIADATEKTVRVVVQQNAVGAGGMSKAHLGLDLEHPGSSRDVFFQGNCEEILKDLMKELDWVDDDSADTTRRRPDPPAPNHTRRNAPACSGAASQPFTSQKQPPRGSEGKYRGPHQSYKPNASTARPAVAASEVEARISAEGDNRQAELPDYKDQFGSVESRPVARGRQESAAAAAHGTRVAGNVRHEGPAYPDFKDQCRSVVESRPTVPGISSDDNNSPLTVPFATAVASLTIDGDEEEEFVFRPSCSSVEALQASRTHADIVRAIHDIGSAVNQTNPNRTQESHTIVAAGGLEAIRESMKAYPNDEAIQESSCSALWYLAATDDTAVASTCLPAVLKAMKAIPTAAGVQHNACGVLRTLAANKAICPKIVRAGGVVATLIAMRNHPNAPNVQTIACGVLASLAKADAALICQQGGIVDIVSAMKSHREVALVQEQACGAIWKLAINNEEGQERIRRDGAIAAIQAALAKHQTNDLIQTYGAWALETVERKGIP